MWQLHGSNRYSYDNDDDELGEYDPDLDDTDDYDEYGLRKADDADEDDASMTEHERDRLKLIAEARLEMEEFAKNSRVGTHNVIWSKQPEMTCVVV